MDTLVFDIETIPDAETGRRLYQFKDLSDEDVVRALEQLQYQKTGKAFLPHYLHRIVVISLLLVHDNELKLWSLSGEEKEIVQRFYTGIDQRKPNLVSWNGGRFDLPVLHYRSLLHQISAPMYWELGEKDREFKFNNYINRYHLRHLDLMDMIAGYDHFAFAPLDKIAKLIGARGKPGIDGSQVWEIYQRDGLQQIQNYCESDVINTYLVYLRFQLMRGQLTQVGYQNAHEHLQQKLRDSNQDHLKDFLVEQSA